MKRFFNFKLYREALKQLKLIGIAAAIVVISLSLLIPTVTMIDNIGTNRTVETLSTAMVSLPSFLLLFFAPFFTMSIFRFLNDRAKSDFYHSIPYTRTCVFVSFFAAVLTWITAIASAAVLLPALLWWIYPFAVFSVAGVILYLLILILGCFMLASLMAVAMAMSGTATTNLALFGLCTCFVRVVCYVAMEAIQNIAPILVLSVDATSFFAPEFLLPFSIINFAMSAILDGQATLLSDTPMILYSCVVTALLMIVAGVLFCRRRSEIAGNSAPSARLQHWYRIFFTLPFALIIPAMILCEVDFTGILVVFVLVLLVYFLFELITTKKAKNMVKAIPYFAVILACMAVFGGAVYVAGNKILNTLPDWNDVSYVSVIPENYGRVTYESLVTGRCGTDDVEAIQTAVTALETTIDGINNGTVNHVGYAGDYYVYDSVMPTQDKYSYEWLNLRFTLKNGSHLDRCVRIRNDISSELQNTMQSEEGYLQAYLSLPETRQLTGLSLTYHSYKEVDKQIWEAYRTDFNALSEDDRLLLKNNMVPDGMKQIDRIGCSGEIDHVSFYSNYCVTDAMPKTAKLIAELYESEYNKQIFNASDLEMIRENYENIISGTLKLEVDSYRSVYLSISGYYEQYASVFVSYDSPRPVGDYDKKLIEAVLNADKSAFDASKPYVLIDLNYNNSQDYISTQFVMNVDDTLLSLLMQTTEDTADNEPIELYDGQE